MTNLQFSGLSLIWSERIQSLMTSSNGNIFHVTGPSCGDFTGHRWIPITKASDAEFWCFLWSSGLINNRYASDSGRHPAHHDVTIMRYMAQISMAWYRQCVSIRKNNIALYHRCHIQLWMSAYEDQGESFLNNNTALACRTMYVWNTSNPAFSRGRQLVSFRFEYRLPVPEHRN